MKPRNDYENFLMKGAICKYKVVFPGWASGDDEIVVKPEKLAKVQMMTVDTYRYKSTNFTEMILNPGQNITVKHPNVLFIVFLADILNAGPGDFAFSY